MQNSKKQSNQMGAAITVRLLPRGKEDAIIDIKDDGTILIQLTLAPDTKEANHALMIFLGKILTIPISSLEIVAGQTGQNKLVSIIGISAGIVHEKILKRAGLTQAELNRRR